MTYHRQVFPPKKLKESLESLTGTDFEPQAKEVHQKNRTAFLETVEWLDELDKKVETLSLAITKEERTAAVQDDQIKAISYITKAESSIPVTDAEIQRIIDNHTFRK